MSQRVTLINEKKCGCTITRYGGGKTAISGCKKHRSKTGYQCGVCGWWGTKKDLKVHQNEEHGL